MVSKPSLQRRVPVMYIAAPAVSVMFFTAALYSRSCTLQKNALQSDFDVLTAKLKTKANADSEPVSVPAVDLPPEEYALHLKKAQIDYDSIWMSSMEINLVLRYLNKVDSYLEWGSGGSTFNFPLFTKRAVSIEHDQKWCGEVREKLAANARLQHIEYHCVPVARGYMGWGKGNPFEEGNYTIFKKYVDEISNVKQDFFQFVLVDGRARVDAAIKALSYINDNSYVAVHDARRIWDFDRYSDITKYYVIVDSAGGDERQGIAILRRKPEYRYLEKNHKAVQKILDDKYNLAEQEG